jgi:hypothetical protein
VLHWKDMEVKIKERGNGSEMRAPLHEESGPTWGFDMHKSLYVIVLIHEINPKAFA